MLTSPLVQTTDADGADGGETAAQALAKKNTRARRLSYVTDSVSPLAKPAALHHKLKQVQRAR